MTKKVVINNCYGGFKLSEKAVKRYEELSGTTYPDMSWDVLRHEPALVQVVEELGQEANGSGACLSIEEIPGNRYYITEYDGIEEIHCPEAEFSWIVIED